MAGTDAAYGPWLVVVGLMVVAAGLGRLAAFRTGWDSLARDESRGPVMDPPEPCGRQPSRDDWPRGAVLAPWAPPR